MDPVSRSSVWCVLRRREYAEAGTLVLLAQGRNVHPGGSRWEVSAGADGRKGVDREVGGDSVAGEPEENGGW